MALALWPYLYWDGNYFVVTEVKVILKWRTGASEGEEQGWRQR